MPLLTSVSSHILQYQYLHCLFRFRHLPVFQTISNSTAVFTRIPTSCCFTNCSTCSIAPTATTLMGRKFAYFFICNTSESSYLPVALSSCSHVPSPYCIVPRDFSALLGYCIVPCAGCLWCFLMENDLKNANCEIP